VSALGITNFASTPASYFIPLAASATMTPIAANVLVPGDVFPVVTNGGKTAGGLVTANSGGSISIRFTTFGASAPAGTPAIVGHFSVPSYILIGLPPGKGGLALQNDITMAFSASGLDIGLALASISFPGPQATFQ